MASTRYFYGPQEEFPPEQLLEQAVAAEAMIPQAWATLERLFPGRPYLGIGSGEALNEVPVGDEWPSPKDQIARMEEALSSRTTPARTR